jgi:DNA-binding response OmpR family regulator
MQSSPLIDDIRKVGSENMEQILIVEDDTDINNMVASALTKAGYECKQSFSGTEAMLYLNKEKFSVIILDLMLPGKSGNSIVEEIKPYLDTSIIVVSAKDELDTKVNLLFSGADDYITKPFEIDELVARVAVQIRKHSTDKTESVYHYKDMVLNITEHSISVLGHPISFTRQEFKILELLITNPKRVFSKKEIYDYAWDDLYIGEDRTINVHVSNIRQKIKAFSDKEYIETVWGVGFKLAD